MKKILSTFLACTMVAGVFTTVPVAAENNSGYSEGDIAIFNSFSDYDGVYQYRDETKAPDGFIFTGAERKTHTAAYKFEDDTRTSKVMQLGMDAFPILPFGTNFLDGYMHLSFDYYTEADDATDGGGQELKLVLNRNATNESSTKGYGDLEGNIVSGGTTWNQNEYDYTKLVHGDQIELFGTGSEKYKIARKLKSHQTTLIGVSDKAGTRTYTTNGKTWYKVDVYIDRETKDSNNYFVYIDGVLQDYGYVASGESFTATDKESGQDFTSSGRRAIKGLGFWCDAVRNYGDARLVDANNKNTAQTDPGYVYIDNVYVSQYNANDCTNDALKIVADDQGEIMSKGTKFNIGFSEYLSSVPAKENIVIKKQGTNEVFTDFTVTADKAQATLTFTGELENGVYEVSVTGVKGLMSGSEVTNTVEFKANAAATDATETAYYYVNEDFNEFETGMVMPNWYYGRMNLTAKDKYNRYFMGEVKDTYATEVKATTGADNSPALELSKDSGVNSNDLYYFFPRGIASGDFKAEFDISHDNGGWTFGFVNYDDYNSVYTRNTYGRVTNGTGNANKAPENDGVLLSWQAELYARERMESSILLGMARNNYTKDETEDGADASNKRAFSPNLGFIGQDSTTVVKSRYSNPDNISVQLQKGSETENMTIAPSVWSKVEISANDNSKVYTVKVTPYKADGTLDTANAQITEWTDKETNRYHKGIMGIHFARVAYSAADLETYSAKQTGSVKIDNVKVYKEATYYLYDDFDDYATTDTGTEAKVLPSGWSSWNDGNAWREFRYEDAAGDKTVGVTSSIGKTGNAEDKSMFMYYSTPVIYKTFDKPVPAGEPFVMEFDMYNHNSTGKDDSYSTVWMFMQMGKEDTQQLVGYNTPGGISANGKVFVAPASDKSEGPDATTNIINDATMATYKPYATAEGEEAKTVEDSYARINGNLSRFNVLFGRYLAWNNNHTFKYHSSGKWDAYRGFHGTDTNIDMQDEINKWVNYKVLCKPVSTSKTEYTITKTVDGVSTSATFTNDRNWMEHDTYALGFAIPFKNGGLNNVSNGSIGNKIDNIKVYAVNSQGESINTVNKNYIEKIEAKTETEAQDITATKTIPVGTEKLDITFSAPVKEKITATLPTVDTSLPAIRTDRDTVDIKGTLTGYFDTTGNCYTDYTSILDTISDVVSLRKFGSQVEADYTVSLSADKKTVSLTFTAPATENDKYTLGINKNIAFSGDGYASLADSFVQSYTVSGEFTPEAGEEFAEINVTVFRGTADIKIDKAGELVTGEKAKASVRYSNTKSEPADAFVGYAFYDTTNEVGRLLDLNAEVITMEPKSSGETEFATFEVPEKMDLFKGFAWSYPDMKPYKAAFEMK